MKTRQELGKTEQDGEKVGDGRTGLGEGRRRRGVQGAEAEVERHQEK